MTTQAELDARRSSVLGCPRCHVQFVCTMGHTHPHMCAACAIATSAEKAADDWKELIPALRAVLPHDMIVDVAHTGGFVYCLEVSWVLSPEAQARADEVVGQTGDITFHRGRPWVWFSAYEEGPIGFGRYRETEDIGDTVEPPAVIAADWSDRNAAAIALWAAPLIRSFAIDTGYRHTCTRDDCGQVCRWEEWGPIRDITIHYADAGDVDGEGPCQCEFHEQGGESA